MEAVIGLVVECTIKPILHELGYLFRYNENIKEDKKKLETLGTTKDSVHILVSQEKAKGNAIFGGVTKWLDNVKEVLDIAQQNEPHNPSCFNLLKRHQLSRKAKKRLENVIELINEGRQFNKDNVGYPVPSPHTSSSTLPANYQMFESRTLLTEEIKEALANPNIYEVGVCGMGGVGKTALLSEVKKLVLESNLFDQVIQVEVGQSKTVFKIQGEIGDKLNMQLDIQSEDERACRLQTYIAKSKENILFMLDDLWKEYDVEKEFEIPRHSESRIKGCKILMTSRSKHTLKNNMNIEKLFNVKPLTTEESRTFFTAIVGKSIEDGYMQQIAKDVVQQCGGLPIALKIIAIALKGKRVQVWKDVSKSLKNRVEVNIPGVTPKLYSCLQFSYDSIEDDAKLVLLLCSVFPDDHRIEVKDLQMYAMGMRLLNHINTWEGVRNRVIKLVDDLKSSNLLLESDVGDDEGDDYVKMHDVVHDFAKYIGSQTKKMYSLTYNSGEREWEEYDRHGSYNAIFVDCTQFANLPPKFDFPNLHLLRLQSVYGNEIPIAFFEGMEGLQVLDLRCINFKPQIMMTTLVHSLNSLQTLCFTRCGFIDMDMICRLKKLKILTIKDCNLDVFPASMTELKELKVLFVSFCFEFNVAHPNIITSMTSLEELKLHRFPIKEISKFDGLTRLFRLELSVDDVDILLNKLSTEIARKLEEFFISTSRVQYYYKSSPYATALELNYIKPQFDSIPEVLQILLQKCEHLKIRNSVDFINLLSKENGNYCYTRVKKLEIDCEDDKNHLSPHFDLEVLFPELMDLTIYNAPNLKSLWCNNGITASPFCKLRKIFIEDCWELRYVFPSRIVKSLVFLHEVRIDSCSAETIFEMEEQNGDVNHVVVPLTSLWLWGLQKLKHVWDKDPVSQLLTFPNLKVVEMSLCSEFATLFPASFINHMKEIEELNVSAPNQIFSEDESLQLISPEIALFPRLRYLAVSCKALNRSSSWLRPYSFPKLDVLNLISLDDDDDLVILPLEMSELLYRVEALNIRGACKLVKVFRNGEENNQNHQSSSGGKLKNLTLCGLPKLTHVWDDQMTSTCFDGLEVIDVDLCHNLRCLLPSSITFSNLRKLVVNGCYEMMSLFDFSVANNLVNLTDMTINSCTKMSCIVVAPEGEEEKGEDIIFKKLRYLELYKLPNLTSFQFGKNMLKFLCLNTLEIGKCPQMKTFSYGKVNTPKLSSVSIQSKAYSPPYDINVIIEGTWNDRIVRSIRNLFIQYQREESNDEDNDEDDDEDDSGDDSDKYDEEDSGDDGGEDNEENCEIKCIEEDDEEGVSEVYNISTRLKRNS